MIKFLNNIFSDTFITKVNTTYVKLYKYSKGIWGGKRHGASQCGACESSVVAKYFHLQPKDFQGTKYFYLQSKDFQGAKYFYLQSKDYQGTKSFYLQSKDFQGTKYFYLQSKDFQGAKIFLFLVFTNINIMMEDHSAAKASSD